MQVDIFKSNVMKSSKIVNVTSVFRYLFSAVSVWDLIIILVLFKYHYYNFTIWGDLYLHGVGLLVYKLSLWLFLFFVIIVVVFAIKL